MKVTVSVGAVCITATERAAYSPEALEDISRRLLRQARKTYLRICAEQAVETAEDEETAEET